MLLSLSVFCDEICELHRPAARPAIVFRLHDYPSVVVQPADSGARGADGLLLFQRGKSCLLAWPGKEVPTSLQLVLLLIDLVDPPSASEPTLSGPTARPDATSLGGKGILVGRAVQQLELSAVTSSFVTAPPVRAATHLP